ncbi:hypothetical protein [Crocinitomix algicola]|uniref:hypothetical protein n=1 Tax=Crocinitomix algicola TaxID=1740263 RepID=UPI001112EA79|nr:hypothetical protein [Crocinitomix algicola]
MDAIMNSDQIIKIEDWFIHVDMESESVFTVSAKEENAYKSLKNRTNRNMKTFSISDDVLDHLKNGTHPNERGCGGIGGRDKISPKIYIDGSTWYRSEMHFNRFGVYYVLKGGFDSNDIAGFGGTVKLEIKGPEGWCQRRPCGEDKIKTVDSQEFNYTGTHQNSYKFYQNVRNLNGFYFYVRTKVAGLSTSWTGDKINSPY